MSIYKTCSMMLLLGLVFMAGCGRMIEPVPAPETTAPTVSSSVPANAATGVALNANILVTFSEAMDSATINDISFTLKQGTTAIAGAVTYGGLVASFNPTSNLTPYTIYTVTITTVAKDLAGNALAVDKTWSFTTGAGSDTTAPTVSSTSPVDLATSVALDQNILAIFSEAMDPLTITTSTFTLKEGTTTVPCAVTFAGFVATLNPTSNLTANTTYTVTITTGAKDLAENALTVEKIWSFTTGAVGDTTAPTVSSSIPVNAATGVALNVDILATFSEAMDSATISTSTFTLKQGTTSVPCVVTYVGLVATLNPTNNLTANTLYTATITTGALDLAGNAIAVTKTWTFTTGTAADTTAPTVSSTIPADLATNVALNGNISATFSEGMDPLTITNLTFTLLDGTTPIDGDVTYVGTVATFNPVSNLAANTRYTAMITTNATDLAGNALAVNMLWSFTTGAALDTTAPTVSSTSPANLATGVAIGGNITATFSEAVDPLTITTTTFTLMQGTTLITGEVTSTGTVATFNPTSDLTADTTYIATITTGAKDLAGNALAVEKTWSFTTTAVDIIAPTVSLTSPVDLATGEAVNVNIVATFSEAMSRETISTSTFTLKNGATSASITGEVTLVGNVATLNPISNLAAGTSYEATITTGVKDAAGNAMAANKIWSFTTAASTAEAAGPAAVNLGTAGNFAILSKSGIALSVGGTARVNGNIGVSPAAATYITNASLIMDSSGTYSTSTQVPGYKVYASNYTAPTPSNMTTAISNMETAYDDAAGRSNPTATELGAGDIGGMTLVPGFYKWSSGLLIPTDVYLTGGANDVWIFEIAQNFTLSNGIQVHMTGGAQAKNVYWQIAGHATLGTTSVMNGNMICLTDMTMQTGSTLNGRLLAQTAVTLQENTTVNLP